jgi:hypothetical protein
MDHPQWNAAGRDRILRVSYFLIIPGCLVLWTLMLAAALLNRGSLRLILFYGTLGSVVGFVLVNILLWAIMIVLIQGHLQGPAWLQFIGGLTILFGPIPASAVGFTGGFVWGAWMAYRRRAR